MSQDAHAARDIPGYGQPVVTTRDRLVDTALDLFYTHGFHAVGIDQIIASVGVTKTTFYNHFESKDELIVESIRRRDVWEARVFSSMVEERAGGDPRARLLAMFDVLDAWFSDEAFRGCLFIHACAEFPSPHDPVHEAAARHYVVATETIESWATEAGAADPAALAQQLTLLLQGAFTNQFMTHASTAARIARGIAERLVNEHLA